MGRIKQVAGIATLIMALMASTGFAQSRSSSVYGTQRTGARKVSSTAQPPFGAGAGMWFVSPDGDITADSGILRGTNVDVEDDLGLDDEEVLQLRGWIKLGRHRIQAGYMDLGFSGSSRLTREVAFGGFRYPVSAHVESDVDITAIEVVDQISLTPSSWDMLDLGIILGGDYYDLDASLTAAHIGRGTASGEAIAPKIGLFGRGSLAADWIRWNIEAAGTKFDISDADVSYLTIQGNVGLALGPFATVWVGYRHLDADVTVDDFSADLKLTGPQAMLEVQF